MLLALFAVTVLTSIQANSPASDGWRSPVGVTANIAELVIPGPRLYAKPIALESPLVLRLVNVFAHGEQWRYNLEWYGLEPGEHNLLEWLETESGEPAQGSPLLVTVITQLPPGIIQPNPLSTVPAKSVGGYVKLLWLGGIAWFVILLLLLRGGRKKRAPEAEQLPHPITLADRLRPLTEMAIRGELNDHQKAELEMALLQFWQQKLGLEHEPPGQALQQIRRHPEAGQLILALEGWLHRPAPQNVENLEELLEPYRKSDADAVDLPVPSEAVSS